MWGAPACTALGLTVCEMFDSSSVSCPSLPATLCFAIHESDIASLFNVLLFLLHKVLKSNRWHINKDSISSRMAKVNWEIFGLEVGIITNQ